MKIRALEAMTIRDSSTGELVSIAYNSVAEVNDTLGASLISDGLAEAYTLISPTGTKSITENGTDIDVAQYAKADVAVEGGSSDFSTAEVSVTLDDTFTGRAMIPHIVDSGGNAGIIVPLNADGTYIVPLYKGVCAGVIDDGDGDAVVTATGDIQFDDGLLIITGDGTVTIAESPK